MLELCHYEWVELSLDVLDDESDVEYDPEGDLLGRQVVSKAVRPLVYTWPVHTIGVNNLPEEPAATYLIVYRRLDDSVRFMESSAMTHRLLSLLNQLDSRAAIERLHAELTDSGRDVGLDEIEVQALTAIQQLRDKGILLGTLVGGN